MKKLILTTLIAAGLGITAQGAFAAATTGTAGVNHLADSDNPTVNGADGIIQIQGKVVDTTCTITGNAGKNINVDLPVVRTEQLAESGKTAGDTPFDIKLSGCKSPKILANGARAFFDNSNETYVDRATGRLKNIAASAPAQNVTVELLEGDTVINVAGQANNQNTTYKSFTGASATANNQNGSVTLTYKARYHAEGAATAGPVVARVEYQIEYQ
ncbi:fimbrial protein [Gallibacterium melopsittaci]|uniref:Fimbrial protein n=1 Tax=Gallibacterium melopsittaci TaxID=516063 RepID=A0ABV6HX74_9PAST